MKPSDDVCSSVYHRSFHDEIKLRATFLFGMKALEACETIHKNFLNADSLRNKLVTNTSSCSQLLKQPICLISHQQFSNFLSRNSSQKSKDKSTMTKSFMPLEKLKEQQSSPVAQKVNNTLPPLHHAIIKNPRGPQSTIRAGKVSINGAALPLSDEMLMYVDIARRDVMALNDGSIAVLARMKRSADQYKSTKKTNLQTLKSLKRTKMIGRVEGDAEYVVVQISFLFGTSSRGKSWLVNAFAKKSADVKMRTGVAEVLGYWKMSKKEFEDRSWVTTGRLPLGQIDLLFKKADSSSMESVCLERILNVERALLDHVCMNPVF